MRNYYIIGSKGKSEDGHWDDTWDEMRRNNCVSIGWASESNLSRLYGQPVEKIMTELKRKGESSISCRALSLFLNLKPGDIVAVKKFAAPQGKTPRLVIHGYGVVRARGGHTYRFRGNARFRHQISVDFLDCKDREFHLGGYGQTVHCLSKPDHIRRIFAPVLGRLSKADAVELQASPGRAMKQRSATLKSVEETVRRVKATYKVSAEHNKIQNKLYEHLVRQHGAENVLMEHDYVDLQVRLGREITLYEIKPHGTALTCLREALGQIMLYGWRASAEAGLKLRLVIVGPKRMTESEADFLRYLKKRFLGDLEYMPLP